MKFILIIVTLITFLSCSQKSEKAHISGNIENIPDSTKVVLAKASGKKLDSTYTEDSRFSLTLSLNEEPEMFSISFQNDSLWHYEKLFISNEQIDISGDFSKNAINVKIEGSKHNPFQIKIENYLKELSQQRNQIRNEFMSARIEGKLNDSLYSAIKLKLNLVDIETEKKRKEFIEDNIESYYALYELCVYKNDYELTELKEVLKKITKEKKESKYAKVIKASIEYPKLNTNDKYYNFSAKDQNSNDFVFSNLFESNKKYVLLEFSSNSCPYSTKAIPMLNDLNSNSNDNLQIISFSTDEELSDFNSYSHKIKHIALYDGDGTYSETYTKYGVDVTPTYFLFNPKGKLIEKIEGYGEGTKDRILNQIK
ncbi:thioredoxin-like domain-containing protein [Yeosuana marina]|uniref:thioredoxin-like domain-containing protein n=1 Tax=Yeosuana marina TaxID=1565536 RepID=UPI00141E92AA|nr:thioredoxin-like domain-containing protein [Yeosuana marina]